ERQGVAFPCGIEPEEGNVGGIEPRDPHFDAKALTDTLDAMRSRRTVEDEALAGRAALAHQPRGDAARAIAALHRIAAVGIPDAVARRGARGAWRLDRQQLVTAHAGMAIGDRAAEGRRRCRQSAAQVEDDE